MATQKQIVDTSHEWEQFEKSIVRRPASTGNGARGPEDLQPQAEPAEDVVLRRLAERSQLMRKRAEPIGNVVFLHGITGSDLAVADSKNDFDDIWVSIPRLILGGLRKLRLAENGSDEHDRRYAVRPTGVNKQFYARAVVALRAQWNVEPFAYDWRKDIDQASDGLAELIERRFPKQPVHLVAHSMGGLVARNFIRRHSRLWKSMRDANLIRGGRLIMLGTPNYGSFAIAQVLTGTDALLARLERFDLKNNLHELLTITNSFLGTYMLLPAYGKLPGALQPLYQRGTWGATPAISQKHLDRTLSFYKALDTSAATIDPERMVYIAGVNQTTIESLRIVAPGEFEYEFTRAGDGRVPHALGLLDGVRSYYVDEVHGDLARNESILRILDDILQTGTSSEMATTPAAAVRGPAFALAEAPPARSYRSGADRAALDILEDMAERTRAASNGKALSEGDEKIAANALSKREQQIAADAFLHAALGARTPTVIRRAPLTPQVVSRPRSRELPKLKVGVRYGRIEDFKAPLIVVGHYRGVKPTRALGALNAKLGDWIGRAVRRGMISGHVGETFFVPTRDAASIGADGLIIAGMGDYGRFTMDSLRQIMANVAQAAAALQNVELASVLIGTGEGNLSIEQALKYTLHGFASGLAELHEEMPGAQPRSSSLHIVEYDPQRFLAIDNKLQKLIKANGINEVELSYTPANKADRPKARRDYVKLSRKQFDELDKDKQSAPEDVKFDEVRITVEFDRERSEFKFSALTSNAVIPTRRGAVTAKVVDETARLLGAAQSRRQQIERGRALFDYLIPREFEALFENDAAIRMIVDPTSAAIPWEMACLPSTRVGGRPRWFGTDYSMTRQFKTLLSNSVGVILARSEKVRALVIADPAPEPEWRLPGALTEGRLVAKLLREYNRWRPENCDVQLDIEVEEFIGPEEANPTDLIGKLVSGQYDIVHFAGHGDYNKDDPTRSGWVLGKDQFVSATDILRARHAPWLVVANACYSGVVRQDNPYPSLEVARRGAAIAEAFMERGVRNYLGTGWTVEDDQALRFSERFYRELLQNQWLGDAVKQARELVFDDLTGSTWGAYQFYGNPSDKLLPREPARGEQAAPADKPKSPRRARKKVTSRKRARRK